jgi:hypothetical protein
VTRLRLYVLYLAGFLLYGAAVAAGMGWAYRHAPGPPHSLLVHEAYEGEQIKDEDLVSVDSDKIVGRYLQRHIGPGQPITPDDVTEKRTLALSPTLAVVASYDPTGRARPLTAGDRVYLCVDGSLVGHDPLEVEAVACENQKCSATIALKEIPKTIQDAEAAKKVILVDLPENCKKK